VKEFGRRLQVYLSDLVQSDLAVLRPGKERVQQKRRRKMATRANAGGGLGSNKVSHGSYPKQEPKARAVNPGGAAQIGSAMGNHTTEGGTLKNPAVPLYAGPGYAAKGPTPTVPGPGGGRTVYTHSTQDQHGQPAGQRPVLTDDGWAKRPRVTK
jgi:hypothetical protein